MSKLKDWAAASLFPRRCACCGAIVSAEKGFCSECEKSLPRITGEVCPACGRGKKKCTCKNKSNYYDAIAAPFYFEGNIRLGIHRFKFRRAAYYADAYAREMSDTVALRFKNVKFDYITEVPSGKMARRERGYNQCELLARAVSKNTGIPYKKGILKKIYETEKQHGLNYYMRQGNLTGVFDSDRPEEIKDKVILLCDDISTSGETLNECAKMLWLYGAKNIYCISAALTEMKGEKR